MRYCSAKMTSTRIAERKEEKKFILCSAYLTAPECSISVNIHIAGARDRET